MSKAQSQISCLLASVFLVFLLTGCFSDSGTAAPDCNKDYWVATNGSDDANDGSQAKPFKSIERARIAVRNDAAKGQCTINVNINGGVYSLAVPLQFDSQDSGSDQYKVVYQAAPGNTQAVVISGGIDITNFDCTSGTCSATATEWPDNLVARQFYVDDVRAIRARSNYDLAATVQKANPDYVRKAEGYEIAPARTPPNLANPQWAEIVTTTQWKMMRCPLSQSGGANLVPDAQCWANANTFPVPWNFQVLSWIENAPEYLTQPGMWFLNPSSKALQYKPAAGAVPSKGVIPRLQSLVNLIGQPGVPVSNISFKGLQFSYATWLGPNTDGYVSDQSGNYLKGSGYSANAYGHQKIVYSTPGNVNVSYARGITFENNVFSHLGAVGLWLGTGSQYNRVINNFFTDISSSAVQVGGVNLQTDIRSDARSLTVGNQILNNDISFTGRDYYDTAAIYVGFTAETTIRNNTINHTPWTGIAIGWGWGLFDEGGFPGLPNAKHNEWGTYTTSTIVRDNKIVSNRISHFLEELWDGGAIYVNGSQGSSMDSGLLLQLNVADSKRPSAGSNIFYTDGGSRYVTLDRNVSINNPVGYFDFGSCQTPSTWDGIASDVLLFFFGNNATIQSIISGLQLNNYLSLCSITTLNLNYGAEMGGCVPRGELSFVNNYFSQPDTFFDVCTSNLDVPVIFPNLSVNNQTIKSIGDVPAWVISQAGKQN